MTPLTNQKSSEATGHIVEKFSQLETAVGQPKWLAPLRKSGLASFADQGFPTLTDEDWRFTNVAPIAKLNFQLAATIAVNGVESKALAESVFAELPGHRLVFVNGFFCAKLSSLKPVSGGVRIENLAATLTKDCSLIEKHLGKYAHTADNSFAALNQAFFSDGAFIFVPQGQEVTEPVELIYISSAKNSGEAILPRNLIIAEADRKSTRLNSSHRH